MNQIGTKGFHRAFVAISSVVVAVGVLWAGTDTSQFGISPETASGISFVLAVANVVVTALRQAFDTTA